MTILRANYECVVAGKIQEDGNLIGQVQHAAITYNPIADPYAIVITFFESQAVWIFGRDLLKQAMDDPETPHGEGDVRVRVQGEWYILSFNVNGKNADVIFNKDEMYTYTKMVFMTVPEGEEGNFVDWESELGKIL